MKAIQGQPPARPSTAARRPPRPARRAPRSGPMPERVQREERVAGGGVGAERRVVAVVGDHQVPVRSPSAPPGPPARSPSAAEAAAEARRVEGRAVRPEPEQQHDSRRRPPTPAGASSTAPASTRARRERPRRGRRAHAQPAARPRTAGLAGMGRRRARREPAGPARPRSRHCQLSGVRVHLGALPSLEGSARWWRKYTTAHGNLGAAGYVSTSAKAAPQALRGGGTRTCCCSAAGASAIAPGRGPRGRRLHPARRPVGPRAGLPAPDGSAAAPRRCSPPTGRAWASSSPTNCARPVASQEIPRGAQGRHRRDRGPALLLQQRRRLHRHRPLGDQGHHQRLGAAGRLHDHDAADAQPVPRRATSTRCTRRSSRPSTRSNTPNTTASARSSPAT